jgi:chorismate dehydratase
VPRLGCVKYLNARPLVRGWTGEIVCDHPAALCRLLAAGELDVALVSSFEFLRNPIYRIVDRVAIASAGPVYSVMVAMQTGSEPGQIEIDPASATGVSLLRILLLERGWDFAPLPIPADKLSPLQDGRARFLIGDQAIRFRQKFGATYTYWDLGAAWHAMTGLPFVFALWLMRPEVTEAAALSERLRTLRDSNLADLDRLIAEENDFDRTFCRTYFQDHLRFDLGEKEKEGLALFGRLCVKHGLLPDRTSDLRLV